MAHFEPTLVGPFSPHDDFSTQSLSTWLHVPQFYTSVMVLVALLASFVLVTSTIKELVATHDDEGFLHHLAHIRHAPWSVICIGLVIAGVGILMLKPPSNVPAHVESTDDGNQVTLTTDVQRGSSLDAIHKAQGIRDVAMKRSPRRGDNDVVFMYQDLVCEGTLHLPSLEFTSHTEACTRAFENEETIRPQTLYTIDNLHSSDMVPGSMTQIGDHDVSWIPADDVDCRSLGWRFTGDKWRTYDSRLGRPVSLKDSIIDRGTTCKDDFS